MRPRRRGMRLRACNRESTPAMPNLKFEAPNGYLSSVLRELDIDVDSQILVFSKTSFQKGPHHTRDPACDLLH